MQPDGRTREKSLYTLTGRNGIARVNGPNDPVQCGVQCALVLIDENRRGSFRSRLC